MKFPILVFSLLSFGILSAQTLDLSFGEKGVYKRHGYINKVVEAREGLFLIDGSGVEALDLDGNIQISFGDNGSISNPFIGSLDLVTHVQYIDNGVEYIDNRISLIGCSIGAETKGIDLFIQHYNSRTGKCIEDLNFTDTIPGEQEFTGALLDDQLLLFGYSELPEELVSPTEYPLTFFSRMLDIEDYQIGPSVPFDFPIDEYLAVPYHFAELSRGRTLVIYKDFWARSFYEVVTTIEAIGTEDQIFLLRDDIDLSKSAIEIDDQTILTATRRKDFISPQNYTVTVDLSLIDLYDGSLTDLGLDVFPENYSIEGVNEIQGKYLISGYILDEATELHHVVLYSLNKDFTLNADFGSGGMMELETFSDRLNSMKVDHFGENIYLSVSGTRGAAEVFRFKSELSNTDEIVAEEDFVISPNPASDIIYLEEKHELAEVEYSIYSALGKELMTSSRSIGNGIDITPLNPGLFYLVITSKDGSKSKPFIKE